LNIKQYFYGDLNYRKTGDLPKIIPAYGIVFAIVDFS